MDTNQAKQKHTMMRITADTSRMVQADEAMVFTSKSRSGSQQSRKCDARRTETGPASGLSIM